LFKTFLIAVSKSFFFTGFKEKKIVLNSSFLLCLSMSEVVDGNHLREKKEVEREAILTRDSDKREAIKLFLSDSLGVNPYLEKNRYLMDKINKLADSAVKVVDYSSINKTPNGVELKFNKNVIDPEVIVENFKQHGFYYNHSKNDLNHYLREDLLNDNHSVYYNKKNPLKLNLNKGVNLEKSIESWSKFFENFSWKLKPENRKSDKPDNSKWLGLDEKDTV
jgi:hypothetical protein